MKKLIHFILAAALFIITADVILAGNPDRQGEAGAYELLLTPYARTAGLHTLNTSSVRGVDALHLNVAGLGRINKTEIAFGHTRYLSGAGINLNAFGFAQKVGKSGALAISIMAVDFGDIPITTDAQPEGTGGTYSPSFFNIGAGYAFTFENKVSVGVGVRGVTESISTVSAFGLAIDAGVQYVAGAKDQFKFGISLRNIGSPMRYEGEGLAVTRPNPFGQIGYNNTYNSRTAKFELPSVLNLGVSYDFLLGAKNRITVLGNFAANSFSRDQIGGGIEYSFNEMFTLRGAYKTELGLEGANDPQKTIDNGLAAGVSVDVPLKKNGTNKLSIDYSYKVTSPFDGIHNLGVRVGL